MAGNIARGRLALRTRVSIFFLLGLVGVFFVLAGRCFYLQYYRGDYYRGLALRQLQARIAQIPRRGAILDRCGRVLAASNEIRNVFVEPRAIAEPKQTACQLGDILDMPAHEICRMITDSRNQGYVRIKTDVDAGRCDNINRAKIKGVGIESEYQRYYPMCKLAPHAAGFMSADNRALGGIELEYDEELSGSAGARIFLADAFRRPVRLKEKDSTCIDGLGVILTLDATIQQAARTELLRQYESYEAESAVAIVMEPASGAVLAMVSLPDFDPSDISQSQRATGPVTDPNALRNRAITDPFEPGSILKPIVAAIALDIGAVSVNETIFCEHGDYRGKGFGKIGEYGGHQFGDLTVREILVKSSNIGMAKIGQKIGAEKLHRGLVLFGFGKQTDIDLPGEDSGLLWPARKWTGYSVTRIPFGQEIAATAIQIVRSFCVLANGGRQVQPHVVKAVVDNQGRVVKLRRPANPAGFVIRPAVAQWIVGNALTGVVNEGTGRRAALKKWQVFGKTGTANIARSDGKGFSEDYVASFVGAAPIEDPAVIVLVSIRKPNRRLGRGYTGGTVAAPVVGAILEKVLTYLEQTGR